MARLPISAIILYNSKMLYLHLKKGCEVATAFTADRCGQLGWLRGQKCV